MFVCFFLLDSHEVIAQGQCWAELR